jgi:phage anti-repressor protein
MDLIKKENHHFVSAKDLHIQLGIKKAYSSWIKANLKRAMLEEKKDYMPSREESTGGRPSIDYHLTKESALTIIVMSGGVNAKRMRDEVIRLYNMHDTGLAFSSDQICALIDISKAMTLVSIQKEVERKHFDIYNDKYTWYQYRANLLGYNTDDVISAMQLINKKHKSIRTSLIRLDANELVRVGVIDFFRTMGKTEEYSVNVGNLCKDIAGKMELGNIIWDDTIANPLKLNGHEVEARKQLFSKHNKSLI